MFIKNKHILVPEKKPKPRPENNTGKKQQERSSEQIKSSNASWGLRLSRSSVQAVIKLQVHSAAERTTELMKGSSVTAAKRDNTWHTSVF